MGLAALAACALAGCRGKDSGPEPLCYSGVVVGLTCYDGLLIDVDSAYPIGGPAAPRDASALLGSNVIAVLNTTEILAGFGNTSGSVVGKKLYFNYENDPQRQPGWACYALDGVKPAVPHVVLTSFSATPCGPATP